MLSRNYCLFFAQKFYLSKPVVLLTQASSNGSGEPVHPGLDCPQNVKMNFPHWDIHHMASLLFCLNFDMCKT